MILPVLESPFGKVFERCAENAGTAHEVPEVMAATSGRACQENNTRTTLKQGEIVIAAQLIPNLVAWVLGCARWKGSHHSSYPQARENAD